MQTTFNELNGEISPDGRWMAYQSNESGQDEIYVRPFPDADRGRWQMSTGGGTRPLWARSGKELFYLGPSGAVMSASVEAWVHVSSRQSDAAVRGALFHERESGGPDLRRLARRPAVPDGQGERRDRTDRRPASIIVVQNWIEELKRLVPTK